MPDSTWSAKEAQVEAHVVLCSADDCNNGAQVSVVANDGGSQVDALVQLEVGGEEQNDEGYTGANAAAVVNDGDDSLLATMEPKEPAAEENVPAVDDQSNDLQWKKICLLQMIQQRTQMVSPPPRRKKKCQSKA